MERPANDVRNIAFESISDRFSKGSYLNTEVIIDMTTGYINGTVLIKQVKTKGGKSKQYRDWIVTKQHDELIEDIVKTDGISADSLEYTIGDGPNDVRGTYAHVDLIPHAAQWASVKFARKVGHILKTQSINNAHVAKDTQIKSLIDKIDEQNVMIQEILGYAKTTQDDNKTLLTNVQQISEDNVALRVDVKALTAKIELIIKRYVPHETSGDAQLLLIAKFPDEGKYAFRRGQKKTQQKRIKDLQSKGYTFIVYEGVDPNPTNTVGRIIKQLPLTVGKKIKGESLCIDCDNHDGLMAFLTERENDRRT